MQQDANGIPGLSLKPVTIHPSQLKKDKKKAVQNELIDYTIAQLIMSSCLQAHNM